VTAGGAPRSYGVIPDPDGKCVLLLRAGRGWILPSVERPAGARWADVAHLNEAVGSELGLEVTTLRPLAREEHGRFFELEIHRPGETPPGAAWFDRDGIERVRLAESEHRAVLRRCLNELDDDGGELRIDWARPGWFAEAVSWTRDRLAALGLETGQVDQLRTWSISTLLRAATPAGDFYFKGSAPVFAGEPALTRELERAHPGRTPEVVAVDLERRWALLRDFDGTELSVDDDLPLVAGALRTYAEIQVEWTGRASDLLALGCPDRSLDALEAEIDRVLTDEDALLAGRPEGLSPSELRAVPELADEFRAACARLRRYDLPPTLEHGDLHAGNIRRRQSGFLFYDWSDGCLSVPFFSLVPMLEFESLPDARAGRLLRDAYLEPWRRRLGRRLEAAFELARYVGLFHQAISYYRIVERTEARARWEWEGMLPGLVRDLLERRPPGSRS
jgi:hypothetical protein